MNDFRIHIRHVHAAKICSRGARDFFTRHQMDWGQFLREGMHVSELDGFDDAFLNRVIEIARKEHLNG